MMDRREFLKKAGGVTAAYALGLGSKPAFAQPNPNVSLAFLEDLYKWQDHFRVGSLDSHMLNVKKDGWFQDLSLGYDSRNLERVAKSTNNFKNLESITNLQQIQEPSAYTSSGLTLFVLNEGLHLPYTETFVDTDLRGKVKQYRRDNGPLIDVDKLPEDSRKLIQANYERHMDALKKEIGNKISKYVGSPQQKPK